jgi:hypothetical protein
MHVHTYISRARVYAYACIMCNMHMSNMHLLFLQEGWAKEEVEEQPPLLLANRLVNLVIVPRKAAVLRGVGGRECLWA